jgi:hypothetical protein
LALASNFLLFFIESSAPSLFTGTAPALKSLFNLASVDKSLAFSSEAIA